MGRDSKSHMVLTNEVSSIEDIRARTSQCVTEIVANPREYYRVQQILRDRADLLAHCDRLTRERDGWAAVASQRNLERTLAKEEAQRLRAALKEASELLDPARNMTDRVWRERRDKLLAQQDEPAGDHG